jgi:hypothetical protein
MVDILNPKTWNKKTFIFLGIIAWLIYGFMQPSTTTIQATYSGNITEYLTQEGTSVAVGFLEAFFAGLTSISDYIKEHALYFTVGLILFLASFIFYKK